MTEKSPFDEVAGQYDSLFTGSLTGMAQRRIVWRYLKRRMIPGHEILEVNCGTGTDAFYLSRLGCRVTATDASGEMIRQCRSKNGMGQGSQSPVFLRASIQELDEVIQGRQFDVIFSDFSGLNCVDPEELQEASARFHSFLKRGGRMVFVVFGTKCLWERFYFRIKGNPSGMRRRKRGTPVNAQVLSSGIGVWYYSPADLKNHFGGHFQVLQTRPAGLFLPPTYLEHFFRGKKLLFRVLSVADRLAGGFSAFSDRADHYIIEFRKR